MAIDSNESDHVSGEWVGGRVSAWVDGWGCACACLVQAWPCPGMTSVDGWVRACALHYVEGERERGEREGERERETGESEREGERDERERERDGERGREGVRGREREKVGALSITSCTPLTCLLLGSGL